MNTNFFVAEDEVFNPNKVLTRKGTDAYGMIFSLLESTTSSRL